MQRYQITILCSSTSLLYPYSHRKKVTFTKRYWEKVDTRELKDELQKHKIISQPDRNLTVTELVKKLNGALHETANKLCPEVTRTVRYRPNQRWFSPELLEFKRAWYRSRRKCRKNKTEENKQRVRDARAAYENAMIRSRCNHYLNKAEKADSKSMYKTLNYLSGEDTSTILPTTNNNKELANKQNNFFADKITKIRDDISEEQAKEGDIPIFQDSENQTGRCSLENFHEIDLITLQKLVKDMNSKFNPADPLPASLFKQCMDVLGPVVLLIVNKSLKESVFPAPLKEATIRPTIKDRNGDKESLKNYRPISHTQFLGKLLEKVAREQINNYITSNNLHSQ